MLSNKEPMPGTTFLNIRNRIILNVNEIQYIDIIMKDANAFFVQAHTKTRDTINLHTPFNSLEKAENFYIEIKNALFDLDTVHMIEI